MKANNILETIGNTTHLKINRLFPPEYEVWIKLERENPGGSIKDRIALNMVEDAEKKGILKPDTVIIEPTSGNTGIGLAMVAAVKEYRLILVMPESMSVERRKIMETYGADFELTPREKGMNGALTRAKELLEEIPESWMPSQFENDANVDIHRKATAREIINDFPEGIDYLITGVGTGGHITGITEILKPKFGGMKTFAVEPAESPVISGGDPGPHGIQGIGAGFIPKILR
jgi:cysteine synthase A